MSSTPDNQETAGPVLFKDRNFVLLWLSQLISSLGDSALVIAVPIAIYRYTHGANDYDKVALSFWALASALPVILLGLFAGVFVDRWNRRRTMLFADIARSLNCLLLLTIRSHHDLWIFYITAFLASAFSCFFSPARSALMASILPRQMFLRANAISNSAIQIVQFAGPALTAVLLKFLHIQGVFLFDAATFMVSALCLFLVTHQEEVPKRRRLFKGVWQEAVEGLNYVRRNQTMNAIYLIVAVVVLAAGIYNTLEVAFAKDVWGVTDNQFALLMASFGLGTIAAGLLVAGPLQNVSPHRLTVIALALMAAANFGFSWAQTYQGGAVALFLIGFGNMLFNIPIFTVVQSMVADSMLGRVGSTLLLLQRSVLLVAAVAAGVLSRFIEWRPLFASLSVFYLICVLLAVFLLERKPDAAAEPPLSVID